MNGDREDTYEQETAFDLFLHLQANWLRLQCGCADVDTIFHGGIIKGEITEFVGSIAVGKTQMCLSLSASVLLNNKDDLSHVIYVDTNGSFRSSRLLQILSARGQSMEDAIKLLSRVVVARVYDEHDLQSVLTKAEKYDKKVELIVVDSIGAALAETALNYLEGGKEVQEEIITKLRRIARSLCCVVVSTNYLVYWNDCPAPSLGRKWNSAVHSRFLMAKLPESHYIQLIQSTRFMLTGERAYYKINESGIASMHPDEVAEQTQKTQAIINENWESIMQSCSQMNESQDL